MIYIGSLVPINDNLSARCYVGVIQSAGYFEQDNLHGLAYQAMLIPPPPPRLPNYLEDSTKFREPIFQTVFLCECPRTIHQSHPRSLGP